MTKGERIKEGLRLRDMIQADLVEKTGLPKSAISSYCNGKYEPKRMTIDQALELAGVNMDDWAHDQGWDGYDYESLTME